MSKLYLYHILLWNYSIIKVFNKFFWYTSYIHLSQILNFINDIFKIELKNIKNNNLDNLFLMLKEKIDILIQYNLINNEDVSILFSHIIKKIPYNAYQNDINIYINIFDFLNYYAKKFKWKLNMHNLFSSLIYVSNIKFNNINIKLVDKYIKKYLKFDEKIIYIFVKSLSYNKKFFWWFSSVCYFNTFKWLYYYFFIKNIQLNYTLINNKKINTLSYPILNWWTIYFKKNLINFYNKKNIFNTKDDILLYLSSIEKSIKLLKLN